MSEKEKQTAEKLAETIKTLPHDARENLLAYGEGMAAMVEKMKQKPAGHD